MADETSILIRPALKGDAALDGVVNFNDLLILAQNDTGGDFSEDGELANGQ